MTAKTPGGLLDQYKLLGAVIDAEWSTGLDHKIAFHVIDNYRRERHNSRAALRYLEKATGARRPSIIASLRRVAEHGAITVARQTAAADLAELGAGVSGIMAVTGHRSAKMALYYSRLADQRRLNASTVEAWDEVIERKERKKTAAGAGAIRSVAEKS